MTTSRSTPGSRAGSAPRAAKSTKAAPATPVRPTARAVRGSQSGRPIMALLDLLGRRWTLRVLWELRGEALSFRALQAACGAMSPSVLNLRLAELRTAQLIEAGEAGYVLTAMGRELLALFGPLNLWAERWVRQGGSGRGAPE